MKIAALTLALALPLTAQLNAQAVGGHVVIHSGPVSAGVVFGPRYAPVRPYYGPHVVVLGSPYYGPDYWYHNGYTEVTVWYDPERDCYYDHADPRFGYRPVVVYRRGNRFFREPEFRRPAPVYRDRRYARDDRYDRDNRYGHDDRDYHNDHGHGHGHGYGHDGRH